MIGFGGDHYIAKVEASRPFMEFPILTFVWVNSSRDYLHHRGLKENAGVFMFKVPRTSC